ncbi:hypothetical protein [Roseateles sp.]|uniref:hypothetical protein n=1 Tax=Roseateles sp. TaxID=1971397 RepID=UPI002F412B38
MDFSFSYGYGSSDEISSAFDYATPSRVSSLLRSPPQPKKVAPRITGKRIRIVSPGENLNEIGGEISLQAKLFAQLKDEWREAVAYSSSPTEMAMHPAYQRIIGMGREALPFIFAELKASPFWWFWALRAITGHDPVDASMKGRLELMSKAWLQWWELNKDQ